MIQPTSGQKDIWATWLRHRRHGGDVATQEVMLQRLQQISHQILGHAQLRPSDHLLDVGCGDGLVGFAAMDQLPTVQVTFSDVSSDLLSQCEEVARNLGLVGRCHFVQADAAQLQPIPDAVVDVVAMRSVLIYVSDKVAAFSSFYRVLRPGGRLSLFEPINRFPVALPSRFRGGLFGYDVGSVGEIAKKINTVYQRQGSTPSSPITPMVDFDERDLVAMAVEAGFREVHLELRIDIAPGEPKSWEGFVNSAPNPLVPSLSEVMDAVLTGEERTVLVECLRPQVEAGGNHSRMAVASLWASKV